MKSQVLGAVAALLGPTAASAAETPATPAAQAPTVVKQVSVTEAHAFLRAHPKAVFLDVRQPDEYAAGHAEGARLKPLPELDQWAAGLDRNATYVLICRSGGRSNTAAQKLVQLGFTDVTNVTGGTLAWQAAGLPTQK